jgi:hypothetical protein
MKPSLSEKALRLLGTDEIPGRPSQQEKFFVRILELAQANGEQWVRAHRRTLMEQWKQALEKGWVR